MKVGRPLQGELATIDDILERWGKEVGPDYLMYARLDWPQETMLSRIRREGAGAGQSGRPPTTLSDEAAAVDLAVRSLEREKTRDVLRLWYCSRTRGNQEACARRLRMALRTFERHLSLGRRDVAAVLDIVCE